MYDEQYRIKAYVTKRCDETLLVYLMYLRLLI